MQRPLTLRQNFSWTFLGNAVYAGCQWAMLVVLAKLGTPAMVGQFTLGLAIAAPVIMFTNLNLRVVQATDANERYQFRDYLGLRLISTALAMLILAVIIFTAGYRWETAVVVLILGFAKGVEAISDIVYGLMQQHERMDRIAISLMIKGPLSLLFLAGGIYVTKGIVGGTIGLAIAWVIVLVSYDIRSGLSILKGLQPPEMTNLQQLTLFHPWGQLKLLKKLAWLCLPLGLVMMLISLNTNVPRYFIERYLGERELGIFAAIAYLMTAGGMVVSALGESACPRLSKYYATQDAAAFRTLLLKLVGIGALLGLGSVGVAAIAGKEILTLLYRPEYAQYADLFVWLMMAAGIGYVASLLGYSITAARYFRVQLPLFMVVTGISTFACLELLPRFGLNGAAIALIISAIVQIVITLGVIVHAFHRLTNSTADSSI